MQNQSTQERIRSLYQMLFEMATGNHSFRVQKLHDQDLDELAAMLNTIADKMHKTILKSGYVNPSYTYQTLIQATIILDPDFAIKSFSSNIPKIFDYPTAQLFGANFNLLLAPLSLPLWDKIKNEITTDEKYHNTIQLVYARSNNRLMPTFCTISKLLYSDKIIVSSVTTILEDYISGTNIKTIPTARKSDAALAQDVYEYIKKNLDDPLPSTRELSILFGTNEFRLKDGFRHFYNTSIYQFYIEEKLKRAHLLIQQTNFPIKTIALMSGFNDYTNFYKSFKKRFNYSPSELSRGNSNKDDPG